MKQVLTLEENSAYILLLTVLYFVIGVASYSLSVSHHIVTLTIFAAEGIALAFVALFGWQMCMGVFLGQVLLALFNDLPWQVALGIAATHSVEAMIGGLLFHRIVISPKLETRKDVFKLAALIFFILQPISATFGNVVLWLDDMVSVKELSNSWFAWWFGNSLGQILVTPLLLSVLCTNWNNVKQIYQVLIILFVSVAVTSVLSLTPFLSTITIFFAVMLPVLTFIAASYGTMLVSLATLTIAIVVLFCTQHMTGAFVQNETILLWDLNIFFLSIALIGLFIAALLNEYKAAHAAHIETLDRLQKIAERVPGMVYQFRRSSEGVFSLPYGSKGFKDLFRLELDDVREDINLLFQRIHPDDLTPFVDSIQKSADELTNWNFEFRVLHEDGTCFWLVGNSVPQREMDGSVVWNGFAGDITERKDIEIQLRIAATAFETQEGIMITDAKSHVIKVNHAFSVITGYSEEDIIGKTPRVLQSGGHEKAFYAAMWENILKTGSWQGEIWNKRKNGQIYPQYLSITAVKNEEGVATNYVSTITDITNRKVTEETINQLAFHDAITGLPNRRLLEERLKHGIEVNRRSGNQMGVLMIDLEGFNAINDSFGKAVGDELLQQVANRMKACVREVDTVARFGSAEFVVLLEAVSNFHYIDSIANSIIHTLSEPFKLDKHEAIISASIGISIHPLHGESWEILMAHADIALYHAKDNGKECFAYFSNDFLG